MAVKIGVSELPGRTFGKTQVMTNTQAAYNLVAALTELHDKYGERVTTNEGDRSRPDQDLVYESYLNGGVLAARPYTSTHDPQNYGNAADLGMTGGAVITDRARNLLDGNHPDGVVGRKYGVYNTGRYFFREERWHYNVYPERAAVLAPKPEGPSLPGMKPAPREAFDVKVIKFGSFWGALIGTKIWKIASLRVSGQTFTGSQVKVLLQRVEASTAEKPAEFNDLEFVVIRTALKKF